MNTPLSVLMSTFILALHCSLIAEETPPVTTPEPATPPSVEQSAQARLGINLTHLADWNSELPFFDVFRMSRSWISQQKGKDWGQGPELNLDEHGWVTALEPDCYAETLVCTLAPGNHYPSGTYTLLYDGEGEITASNAATVTSSEPGRILLNVDSQRGDIKIQIRKVNPANYIRNIRVLMPGFADYDYRQPPWHPDFLERWKGFACLRLMDWQDTNNAWLQNWADRPSPLDATTGLHKELQNGLSFEWMCDLINRVDIDAWFCVPHTATDACVREMAAFLRDHIEPGRTIYIEYSNETWNGMFSQYTHAAKMGKKLGASDKDWEAAWYYTGLRSEQVFKIFEDVFGDEMDRVVRVVPTQAANVYVLHQILKAGNVTNHMDAIAIAPYITLNVDEQNADRIAAMSTDEIMDLVKKEHYPQSVDWIQKHAEVARMYGVKLIAYEGGQHLVGIGQAVNNDALTEALKAANRSEQMGALYTRYFDAWEDAGGDLFCVWCSIGDWSKWGSWGLAEFANDNPNDIPKYKAVLDWARERGQDVINP